jgi:sugar phosphate isomerase/epimerase
MEPGGLYYFNGLDPLSEMMRELECFENIGINLDVSHFSLLDNPFAVLHNRYTKQRIFHTHISQTCRKGHFGDLPLSTDDFLIWLRPLNALAGKKIHSGYVSCELEACSSPDRVISSVSKLEEVLGMVIDVAEKQ